MLASLSSQSAIGINEPLELRPAAREILSRSKSVPGPSAEEFLDQLSDPRQHQDKDFCYAVHCVSPFWREKFLAAKHRAGTYRADQDIDLVSAPERLSQKEILFASIIDPQHLTTWSRTFYLLKFPFDAIVATHNQDSCTSHAEALRLLELGCKPTMTPRELLSFTSPDVHNEVILKGEGTVIAGVGVLAVETPSGLQRPVNVEEMKSLAERLKVPFLELTTRSDRKDTPCTFIRNQASEVRGVEFDYDGAHYHFNFADPEPYLFRAFRNLDRESLGAAEYARVRPVIAEAVSKAGEGKSLLDSLDGHFFRL